MGFCAWAARAIRGVGRVLSLFSSLVGYVLCVASLTSLDGVCSRPKQAGPDEVVVEGGVVPADVREELVALDRVLQRQVLLARPTLERE